MTIICNHFISGTIPYMCRYKFRAGDSVLCVNRDIDESACPHAEDFFARIKRTEDLDDLVVEMKVTKEIPSATLPAYVKREIDEYLQNIRWSMLSINLDEVRCKINQIVQSYVEQMR